MIKLFGVTDTSFSSNGDMVINAKKAIVHKEDNGDFYLELETDDSYANDLTEGRIIIANTPQGAQAFRISNPEVKKHKVKIKAYHVFYDSSNYLIRDSYVVKKNCNDALDHLNMATDNQSPFTTLSDITTIHSYRCVRKSLFEAINVILERWGGHLVRDNFNIQIRDTIGQDNGVTIRYAKNLKEIVRKEKWDYVVTKLLPVGKDGILLNALDEEEDVYVYSNQTYPIPYTKSINFTQDNVSEDNYKDEEGNIDQTKYKEALITDLRQQAENYLAINYIPRINYTLKANIETITDIGDLIEVIDEDLDINILTNVIKFEYDCILGKYKEIQFGNFEKKLSDLISDITAITDKSVAEQTGIISVTLSEELRQSTDKIWSVLGNSYVIYEGDKILVVDSLPKETAVNVIMINSAGIGFSHNGINGTFNSAWTIDGTLNMQAINVINFTADLIKGGTLKLGTKNNQSGIIELYDESNTLIGKMDKEGLKMYGLDGSYVLMNNDVGFAAFDRLGNKIYWVSKDEFHMKKGVVEEEIALCNKLRFIPITLTDSNNNITNEGIALVSSLITGSD